MKVNVKYEVKNWAVFLLVVLASFFFHELGHCIVAWCYGIKAVPTPAKEYILSTNIPTAVDKYIALGGITGTVIFTLAGMCYFIVSNRPFKGAVLAGAITTPGVYTLLFILKGRGHDTTEFQDAQAAIGLSYNGHFIDWISVVLFVTGAAIWLAIAKPSWKVVPRIIVGVLVAFIFAASVQTINNAIFDPVFNSH